MARQEYTQLSHYQRLHLKEMLDRNLPKVKMAEKLGVHRSTIFNELKRGTIDGVYDPDYSENQMRERTQKSGRKSIIKADQRLAEYISRLILKEQLSPEKIIERFRESDCGFEVYPVSPATIYTAIDDGLIPKVTRENLNSNINADIVKVFSDGVRFPNWLRKQMKIQDGDEFRLECRKNGDIVLKRVKRIK